jgi:hypothetical protein
MRGGRLCVRRRLGRLLLFLARLRCGLRHLQRRGRSSGGRCRKDDQSGTGKQQRFRGIHRHRLHGKRIRNIADEQFRFKDADYCIRNKAKAWPQRGAHNLP